MQDQRVANLRMEKNTAPLHALNGEKRKKTGQLGTYTLKKTYSFWRGGEATLLRRERRAPKKSNLQLYEH